MNAQVKARATVRIAPGCLAVENTHGALKCTGLSPHKNFTVCAAELTYYRLSNDYFSAEYRLYGA